MNKVQMADAAGSDFAVIRLGFLTAMLVSSFCVGAAETTSGVWKLTGVRLAEQTTGSGLSISISLSGTPEFQSQGTAGQGLGDVGGTAAMFTPSAMPMSSGALGVQTHFNNINSDPTCALTAATQKGVLRPCGTMTVTFGQPVRNPVFHFSAIGGGAVSPGYRVSAVHTLTKSGQAFVPPGSTGRTDNTTVTATRVERTNTSLTGAAGSCQQPGGPNAVCGSAQARLTDAVVAMDVGVYFDGGTDATAYGNDGYRIQWSVDNDFGDAPRSYDEISPGVLKPASHVLSDLELGAAGSVTAEYAGSIVTVNSVASPYTGTGASGDVDNALSAGPLPVHGGVSTYTLSVPVSNVSKDATLCGYIDFNINGTFDASTERACKTVVAGATVSNLVWNVPSGSAFSAGSSYLRLRLGYSEEQVKSPIGAADSGEVEDYAITLVAPPTAFAACPSNAFVTRGNALTSLNLQTGVFTPIIANMNAAPSSLTNNAVNAIGFGKDGYLWGWHNSGVASQLVRMGSDKADLPFGVPPAGMTGAATGFFIADVDPNTGYLVMYSSPTPAGSGGGVVNAGIYILNTATNTWVTSSPVPAAVFVDSTDMAFDKTGEYLYSVENAQGKVFRVPWNGSMLGTREELVTLPLTGGSGGWGAIFLDDRNNMYAYRSGSGTPNVGLIYRIFKTASGAWAYDLLVSNAAPSTNLDGASCPAAAPPVTTAGLLLRKTTTGAFGGPFDFTLTNASAASATVTTTAAGTAVQVDGDAATGGVQAFTIPATGTSVTISESALPAGWRLSTATTCKTSAGTVVGTLSGTTYTIPASSVVAGEAFECNFTNEALADLYMSKTNGASSVISGKPFDYTLLVGNKGPASADGAWVHDPAVSGLSCSGAVGCTSTGSASCPSSLTVTALQAAPGLQIPSLPEGSTVTLTMTCTAD